MYQIFCCYDNKIIKLPHKLSKFTQGWQYTDLWKYKIIQITLKATGSNIKLPVERVAMTTFDFIVYQILSDKIRWRISKANKLELHNKSLHWAPAIGTFDLSHPPAPHSLRKVPLKYIKPTSGRTVWIGLWRHEQSNLLELRTTKIIEQLQRN